MQQIDAMFRNSEAETASETEKSFFQNFFGNLQGFVTVILIVTALVTLCIVFIAANTASMAVRERLRELAVLKAIGFHWRLLFGTLVAEAALLATVAGALGAGLSLGAHRPARRGGGLEPAARPALGLPRDQRRSWCRRCSSPSSSGSSRAWCRPTARRGAAWPRRCAKCSRRAVALPLAYPLRNLAHRRLRTGLTVAVVALVVIATTLFLALVSSLRRTLVSTGSPQNLIVLRKGSDNDGSSQIPLEAYQTLRFFDGIAKDAEGEPLVSPELVVQPFFFRPDGGRENVLVRGVEPPALGVHDEVRIVEGRMLVPSQGEAVLGQGVARALRRHRARRRHEVRTPHLEGGRHPRLRRLLVRERGVGGCARPRERRQAPDPVLGAAPQARRTGRTPTR